MSVHVEVLDPGDGPGEAERAALVRQGVCFRRIPQGWVGGGDHDWHPANLDAGVWYCSRCRRVERRTVEYPVSVQRYENPEDVPV